MSPVVRGRSLLMLGADRLRRMVRRLGRLSVERGVPPSWLGYRWVAPESLTEPPRRGSGSARAVEVVHPPVVVDNPLPRNYCRRADLPDERGWWGYSMHDVPSRRAGATVIATFESARVVFYNGEPGGVFHPTILTKADRYLDLREMRFRAGHAEALRRSTTAARMPRATWILERVYDNHSHWLTAHLPKILLLRERDALDEMVLPPELSPAMASSLRLLDLDPGDFPRLDPARPLQVDELTVLATDRFRPELLQSVQRTYGSGRDRPDRRIYVSRSRAARRRLVNEEEIWPLLASAGFERVFMEELSFEQQVELMGETAVLWGPHGAGLTNMVFCPPGTHVVEVADLGFPNPNFYALACGVGHHYWLLSAAPVGDADPLERNLRIDPNVAAEVLSQLPG